MHGTQLDLMTHSPVCLWKKEKQKPLCVTVLLCGVNFICWVSAAWLIDFFPSDPQSYYTQLIGTSFFTLWRFPGPRSACNMWYLHVRASCNIQCKIKDKIPLLVHFITSLSPTHFSSFSGVARSLKVVRWQISGRNIWLIRGCSTTH